MKCTVITRVIEAPETDKRATYSAACPQIYCEGWLRAGFDGNATVAVSREEPGISGMGRYLYRKRRTGDAGVFYCEMIGITAHLENFN